ncbi:MAG: MFS transporter [Chloroflexi bacterium]|nr:MFS transporter [Chloroflexota bacterium]
MKLSNLYRTYLMIALISAGEGTASSILPPYLQDTGHPTAGIGMIVAIATVFSLISRMPAGLMYKPSTQKMMIRVALCVFAVSVALLPLAADALSLALLRAITGLSLGAATTLNLAALMHLISSSSSGQARGMAFYTAAMSAGFAVGNSLGGWLVDSYGYSWAFRLSTVTPFIAMIIASNVPLDEPSAARRPHDGSGWIGRTRSRLRYLLDARILLIALLCFSLNVVQQQAYTFFPIFATSVGLSLTSIGLLRGIHSVFGAVTRPLSGEVTRIASTDLLANGGFALVVLTIVAIPSFNSMAVFVPLFILLGTSRGIVMVSNAIGLMSGVGNDPEKRGTASGLFNMAFDLGSVFGPISGGLLASLVGIETMFRVGPLMVAAVYFGVLITVTRRQARRREAEAGEAL